ncbi:LysR family transcriptional regulator [Porticoccus sp. W117]|uniref:LysR family transcriptional regulator n=1 Tax=Porticoccus sp. W117 TaxID=3054777 RepID=UPI002593FEF5|nr:LysR family transcriptional regulator [Porticoccus sp. W117]MDM3872557.1 LysR family transcriptional regulator [Porticoccus sp. W117]
MNKLLKSPKVTIEQWRMLLAVVEHGSFAAAADHLLKSQSTVSYAMARLQEQLQVKVFEQKGRKAELTEAGQMVVRRARSLLADAQALEQAAQVLAAGWEPEIRIVVDAVFPQALLTAVLKRFAPESRDTRVELIENSLSGTQDAIIQGQADLALGGVLPTGFLSEPLCQIQFVAVAHPQHPLIQLGRHLEEADLKQHRQFVVRDSGSHRRLNEGWLGSEQRWTVSHFYQSAELLLAGLGYAFIPDHIAQPYLQTGDLVVLPVASGSTRDIPVRMVFSDRHNAGPALQRFAEIVREEGRGYLVS